MVAGTINFPEFPPLDGVRLASLSAGIYKKTRPDLVLIELAESTQVAAMFTRNVFCAAPVQLAREHLRIAMPRLLLINAGNANAGTGEQGLRDAEICCHELAMAYGCRTEQVLPFSTGVIGEYLPVAKFRAAYTDLIASLNITAWDETAKAIMTTDVLPKGFVRSLDVSAGKVTIAGFAKGSGMIKPDLATMLVYIFTDAKIDASTLQFMLETAVVPSFQCISVDGDTSTNDAVVLAATGKNLALDSSDVKDVQTFQAALNECCMDLAHKIIRDGEGATKFVKIEVQQGRTPNECKQVAWTIAHSPLVKTALFASDPNWGRILAAIGRSGIPELDVNKIDIAVNEVAIVRGGGRDPSYTEQQGRKALAQTDIHIRVTLSRGDSQVAVWSNDLSYDYIKINAEYRS